MSAEIIEIVTSHGWHCPVCDRPGAWHDPKCFVGELAREAEHLRRHARETNDTFAHVILALQAAWIEWKHGDGAEHAMVWIENTLDGGDSLPASTAGTDAQAYFDRERKVSHG